MSLTVWILGDQLSESHPGLTAAQAQNEPVQVVMVESTARLRRYPYHRWKLVLLISAMRHFAQELENRGFKVDYRQSENMLAGLVEHVRAFEPSTIVTMQASEYYGRLFQESLSGKLATPVQVLPNTQFLTGSFNPYPDLPADKRIRQESFYRQIRQNFNLLMQENGSPVGGSWNFDRENRQPLPEGLHAPEPVRFEPDTVTRAVMHEMDKAGLGFGDTSDFSLAVTHPQAEEVFKDFIDCRLVYFGHYEDAMSQEQAVLYHSGISPYLNLGLLDPISVCHSVEKAYQQGKAPINSVEGFIRQVAGWREFIYWQYCRQMPGLDQTNFWQAERPLPDWFWDGKAPMNCLQRVIERVLTRGYCHHIERLMVISNFCQLAGINPDEVNRWFLSCFIDAYEWVMLPNVYGMGLFADGGITASKPYIASARYIQRMSNYCIGCRFNPKKRSGENACPYNFLYWNFMIQHELILKGNPRMGPIVYGLDRLAGDEKVTIQREARTFLDSMPPSSQ